MNLVDGSATCETEKEAAHGVGAGYVGAQATPWVTAPRREGENFADCVGRESKEEEFG
jgi:hypothetical protein